MNLKIKVILNACGDGYCLIRFKVDYFAGEGDNKYWIVWAFNAPEPKSCMESLK